MSAPGSAPATDVPVSQLDEADGWLQLDPRTILVEAVMPGLGTVAAAVFVGLLTGWGITGWISLGVGLVLLVGIVVWSWWTWRTTRYRVTGTHVEMRSGVLVRQRRSVPRDRLRSVDLTADVVHRIGGVTVAVIGTGRQGGEADDQVTLRSVAAAEGERLRATLLQRRVPAADGAAAADAGAAAGDVPLARFAPAWVRLGPFSLLGLVAIGGLAAVLGQFSEAIDWPALVSSGPAQEFFAWVVQLQILPTVLVVLVAIAVLNAVLSTVLYVVIYGGFLLVRSPDGTLRLTYGLLTRRSVTIEEARIRGVRFEEPLLLRLGGGAKVKVVAAGLGGKDEQGQQKTDSDLLLPVAPVAVAHGVVADVLGTPESLARTPLRRHPAAALPVLLLRWVPLSVLPAVGLAIPALLTSFPHWPWQVALLVVGFAVLGAVLEFTNLGHARAGEHLVLRGGSGVRRTAVVRCDGVIAWRFRRTIWQRRTRLLTAMAAVAAGSGSHAATYAGQDDALVLARDAVPGWLDPFLEPDTAVVDPTA